MFKHVITVIILCASVLVGNSQLTRFEYGLHGGLNINSVSGTGISKDHRGAITGMNLGGHFKWNSSDHFGIKILLSYDENGYGYHNLDLATSSGTGIAKADILTKLKFVNFPILAEYSAGNRVRLNVDVGLFGGILLHTEHITKYKSNIPPGQEAIMRSSSNDRHILNYGLAVGFGVQAPIAQKITLDLDARNSTGLANVIRINGNNQKVETNCFAIIAGISFKIYPSFYVQANPAKPVSRIAYGSIKFKIICSGYPLNGSFEIISLQIFLDMKPVQHSLLFVLFVVIAAFRLNAQDDNTYKTPPKEIEDLVLATPTPSVDIDRKAIWMIMMERSSLPSVAELAEPELRIAGLRIDPNNFGPSRGPHFISLKLKNIQTKELTEIKDLPKEMQASSIQWSPDESQFAFTNTTSTGIELYRVVVAEKKAYKINKTALNMVLGGMRETYSWLGNNMILYRAVVNDLKKLPPRPLAPTGPNIQESKGKSGASRTYEDLIKTPYDEILFEFYATSQIMKNDFTNETKVGAPGIYSRISPSPDRNYLLVSKLNKPFSYLVTSNGFPTTVEVMTVNGESKKVLANNPSSEGNPIGFDDASPGPRDFNWRTDQPATIYYVQAFEKGLGRTKAPYKDALFTTSPEDKGAPKEMFKTKMRFRNIIWGNDQLAWVTETMNATRKVRINTFNPSTGSLDSLFERSSNDAYSDIGTPVTVKNSFDKSVLYTTANSTQVLLTAEGASPEGSMPFIQSYDLKAKKGKILWRCQAPFYEDVDAVIDPEKMLFVTLRQSQTEVPNYYLRDLRKKSLIGTPITDFKNPYPQLEGVKKEKISYKRADGVDLTADLYLPKNYNVAKDGALPVLIWAYPREYKSASDAAQVRGSKYTFTRINYGSPIFWVTQGYAVMDNAEMPIIGEGGQEPNDNFIPQLYLNAHAAIQAVAKLGVGDSNRVAVGGHSYGAFMTANLLAHTHLFKAGIARSGAYNRTLTPFGFQAEERTYWEAPDVYFKMSPFSYADSIKTPLLMIHGEADDNPGTFPIQSERLFNAVKGHGGTVRLVYLPYEAHGYAGKENILHMLWEQNSWLDKYVKNAKPTPAPTGADDKKKAFE